MEDSPSEETPTSGMIALARGESVCAFHRKTQVAKLSGYFSFLGVGIETQRSFLDSRSSETPGWSAFAILADQSLFVGMHWIGYIYFPDDVRSTNRVTCVV